MVSLEGGEKRTCQPCQALFGWNSNQQPSSMAWPSSRFQAWAGRDSRAFSDGDMPGQPAWGVTEMRATSWAAADGSLPLTIQCLLLVGVQWLSPFSGGGGRGCPGWEQKAAGRNSLLCLYWGWGSFWGFKTCTTLFPCAFCIEATAIILHSW